jgi:hypothetical protein
MIVSLDYQLFTTIEMRNRHLILVLGREEFSPLRFLLKRPGAAWAPGLGQGDEHPLILKIKVLIA